MRMNQALVRFYKAVFAGSVAAAAVPLAFTILIAASLSGAERKRASTDCASIGGMIARHFAFSQDGACNQV